MIQVLAKAEAELRAADELLAQKRKELSEVEEQVRVLLENLKKVEDDMAALKGQALLTENRLIRAGKLTAALGDEAVSSNLVSKFMKLLYQDIFHPLRSFFEYK